MAGQQGPGTGMVVTQHVLAARAGTEMLEAGGTAADAAVAAAAVLTVVDPRSTGLGGDLFALYWPAGAPAPSGLSAAGVGPADLSVERVRGAGFEAMPVDGPWSVTVPGAPAGWQELLDRHGRLGRDRVLAPAIRLARDGFTVTPAVGFEWTNAVPKLQRFEEAARTYLVDGAAPRPGQHFAAPEMAGTLERFVRDGAAPFYTGELAERIAAAVSALGGPLSSDDLAGWRGPSWVDALRVRFRGTDVYEMPPPGQGLVVLEALRIFEAFGTDDLVAADHAAIESVKLAYADVDRVLADPDFSHVPVDDLLSDDHIARRRAEIRPDAVLDADVGRPTDTVYVAVVDAEGSACSFIQSVYDGFGSGVVVPGTAMALQNRGSGFRLEDGHPNRPEPSKRPYHTIIPAMLGDGPALSGVLGVVGGYMQTQGQLQVLRNVFDRGMTPQQAVDAPRFRVYRGRSVAVEDDYDPRVRAGLAAIGHDVVDIGPFERGGAQLILRGEDGWIGGSDRRKDGAVAVPAHAD